MSWIKNLNPFKKDDAAAAQDAASAEGMPKLPKELENDPKAKGMMAMFYRKWKDPAFLKQIRTLALHMQKEGIDVKDQKAVQAWLEKNQEAIKAGKLELAPEDSQAPQQPIVKTGPDVGRNDPCPCGSGKKYKKCCALKTS